MGNSHFISVIVPVYNVEKYLDRCIESVLNQNYSEFELLLVDDCSTDSSGKICDRYAEKDNRVRVFHIPGHNMGVSHARNVGIDNAEGDIITFVDSDDFIEPGSLEMMNADLSDDVDYVLYNVVTRDRNNKIFHRISEPDAYFANENIGSNIQHLLLSYAIGKGYRTDIIKRANLRFVENFRMGEDALFATQYLLAIDGAVKVNSFAEYNYVQWNPKSLSHRYVDNIEETYMALYDVKKALEKFEPYKFPHNKWSFVAIATIQNMYARDSKLKFKERIAKIKSYLDNDEIYEQLKTDARNSTIEKIRRFVFKIRSPLLVDIYYTCIKNIKKLSR